MNDPQAPGKDLAVIDDPPTKQVNQVFRWILSGASEHDIVEAIAAAWPDSDARPLIVAAVAKIAESASLDGNIVLGFCVESTRDLYRRMVEIGDFPGALRAIRQLRDLTR